MLIFHASCHPFTRRKIHGILALFFYFPRSSRFIHWMAYLIKKTPRCIIGIYDIAYKMSLVVTPFALELDRQIEEIEEKVFGEGAAIVRLFGRRERVNDPLCVRSSKANYERFTKKKGIRDESHRS